MQIANHTEHVTVYAIMLDAQNYTALLSNVLYLEYIGYWLLVTSKASSATEQMKPLSLRSLLNKYKNIICKLITNCEITIKYSRNLKGILAFWLG